MRIQTLSHGDAFGWSALLDGHDTLFQMRAHEHSTALCLDGADLAEAFGEDPTLAAEMLRRALHLVAGPVRATEAKLGGERHLVMTSSPDAQRCWFQERPGPGPKLADFGEFAFVMHLTTAEMNA